MCRPHTPPTRPATLTMTHAPSTTPHTPNTTPTAPQRPPCLPPPPPVPPTRPRRPMCPTCPTDSPWAASNAPSTTSDDPARSRLDAPNARTAPSGRAPTPRRRPRHHLNY
ncbi:hypothetical protein H0H92_015647, partial [Tricholoma furcatifolium]